jgi:XapX domain-containing protein
MKSYLFSFAAGLLVGCIYSLIRVRSPAPPLIALVGLLGILLGEQGIPVIKQFFIKEGTTTTQGVARATADPEGKS